MCNVRCANCGRIIDSEDSGETAFCEQCYKEVIKEVERKAYLEGFNHAIELLEVTYKELTKEK